MTHKERLVIEKFLRVAEELADRFESSNAERKRQAITWLRSLLNNDEIRKQVSLPQ